MLGVDAFADEVDGEPVSDKFLVRVRHRVSCNHGPRLRQFEQVSPTGFVSGTFVLFVQLASIAQDHLAFRVAATRVRLRWVIQHSPGDQPQKSQSTRNDESWAPAAEVFVQADYE